MSTCICKSPDCQIGYGLCHCGCGGETSIANRNSNRAGWIKGEPIRYLKGHAHVERLDHHDLTAINLRNRRAVCSRCGEVSIKKDSEKKLGWRCTGGINHEHRLTELDLRFRRAYCLGCLDEVDIVSKTDTKGNRWVCLIGHRFHQMKDKEKFREERNASSQRYRDAHPGRERISRLKRVYGLTEDEYLAKVAEQHNKCYVCAGPPDFHGKLVIDHDHVTGRTRDLLCNRCNRTLGMIGESIVLAQNLVLYLRKWEQINPTQFMDQIEHEVSPPLEELVE